RWLLQAQEPGFKASHLSCAASAIVHSKGIVKVHGVFPSRCGKPASSPVLQVRRVARQDSRTIVTPFVQVGTYPTRNFARFLLLLRKKPKSFYHGGHGGAQRKINNCSLFPLCISVPSVVEVLSLAKGNGHFCHSLHVAM